MDTSDFEGAGAEYRFLLQPVRDLQENWDIDISQHLEEYIHKLMEETENASLDDHGRRKLFNFAEAAVLIHGSTNVYIRKVEYVYQIAVNFFDQLKEGKQKKRRKEDGTDDVDGAASGDEDNDDGVHRNPFLHPEMQKGRLAIMKNVLLKLSKKRPCLPIVPISFTPLAEFEKTDVPLYSRINPKEIVGKKDDFKINICHIHEAVALLDLKNADLIDKFTNFTTLSVIKREHVTEVYHADENSAPDEHFRFTNEGPRFTDHNRAHDDPMYEDVLEDIFVDDMDDPITSEVDEFHRLGDGMQIDDVEITLGADNLDANNLDHANKDNDRVGSRQDAPVEDLDAYEVKNEKSRPFKMNKKCCTVVANQVKMRDYRIAKECRIKNIPNIDSVKNYVDSRMYRRKIKKRSYVLAQFNSNLMDQAILSLNPLIYEEEKRRVGIKKQREIEAKNALRAARRSMRNTGVTFDIDLPDDDDDDGLMFEDVTEELGVDEIINQNEPDEPEEFHRLGDILGIEDLEDSLGVANLYADGLDYPSKNKNRAHFSSMGCDVQNVYDDTVFPDPMYPDDLPPRPISQMDYDELVAYHLRKYWSTAEEATSKFCERVQRWEEKMAPVLEREQMHRDFDTRQYGDELIEHFENKIGSTIDFASIVKDSVDYDLSRYLLVCLILANMQNVQVLDDATITELQTDEQKMGSYANDIKLKLVKLERHHEVFEDEQRLITGQPNQSAI